MHEQPLEDIRIDGFRGLRDLDLTGLGPINVLVGSNNCGKTSILEAISVLASPFAPEEWLEMVSLRDFGRLDESRIQSLRWCFHQDSTIDIDPADLHEGRCEMRCQGGFFLRRLVTEYQEILGEPDSAEVERYWRRMPKSQRGLEFDEPWRGAVITATAEVSETNSGLFPGGPFVREIEPFTVWERLWRPTLYRPRRRPDSLPHETLTPYSYQLNRIQVRSHSREMSAQRKSFVLKLLKVFDPQIRDVAVASLFGRRPALHIDHAQLGFAPLSVFGDAVRRSVLLANTLFSLRNGVLLIDEVETGIHVSGLTKVFSWLLAAAAELNVQVIVTTHSLEAVDAILIALKDEASLITTFHVEQTREGTRAKRVSGDVIRRLRRERGLDIR